jgi:transcriptional regulator with XRE-family HTH domain
VPNRNISGNTVTPAPIIDEQDRAIFAQFLATARLRAGRSLQQIAGDTRISPRHLAALEAGRIEQLPGGVYRRAIVRSYAKCVGLDVGVVLERFERTFGAEAALSDVLDVPPPVVAPSTTQAGLVTACRSAAGALRRGVEEFNPRWPSRRFALPGLVIVAAVAAYAVAQLMENQGVEPVGASVAGPTSAGTAPARVADGSEAIAEGTAGALQSEDEGAMPAEYRLQVISEPAGARVTVDGVGWGFTPLTIHHLPPGDKVVRVTKDGYIGRERLVPMTDPTGRAAIRITLRPRG